jgi:hypothetical protein
MNSEKNADARGKAQKVLQKSEQQGRNEFTIDYDERNPFRCVLFCAASALSTAIRISLLHMCAILSQPGLQQPQAAVQGHPFGQVLLLLCQLRRRLPRQALPHLQYRHGEYDCMCILSVTSMPLTYFPYLLFNAGGSGYGRPGDAVYCCPRPQIILR